MKRITVLLCLALVGCGGGDDSPEEVDATPTAVPDTELVEPTEPTAAPTPTESPAPAGTFDPDELVTEGPDPFDPAATPDGADAGWQGSVGVDRDTGELAAPGFNDVIEAQQPSWAQTADGAAEILLQLDEETEEEQGTVEIDVVDGDAPTATVTITDLPDDSVNAIRYELSFERGDDGLLRFVEGTWAQRCQPGRGHQDFQAELCV